jgi:hypothetical protein
VWASLVKKHEKFLRCHTVLLHLLVLYTYIWGRSVYGISVLQCLIAVSFLSDNQPLCQFGVPSAFLPISFSKVTPSTHFSSEWSNNERGPTFVVGRPIKTNHVILTC